MPKPQTYCVLRIPWKRSRRFTGVRSTQYEIRNIPTNFILPDAYDHY
ncbi:hypothetical protein GGP87_001689 [Salinibacter ruber]|nr:hypothetical protein [Salinibacter ruber]